MILGIVSFLSVLLAEIGVIDRSSAAFLEFESAHLSVFFTAVMLTIQAVCIYVTLQFLGRSQDMLEEMNLSTFIQFIQERTEQYAGRNRVTRWLEQKRNEKYMIFKLFRSYFMSVHRLPVLFPFAKYLKAAQDSRVSVLIEIEPIIWIFHIAVWWIMFFVHSESAKAFGYVENSLYAMGFFMMAAIILSMVHFIIIVFLSRKTDELLAVAGCSDKERLMTSIQMYAWKEEQILACEAQLSVTENILKQMKQQNVIDHRRRYTTPPGLSHEHQRRRHLSGPFSHPAPRNQSPPSSPKRHKGRPSLRRDVQVDLNRHLKMYFRPKAMQGILKFLLLGNAFFQAFYMVGYLNLTIQNFHTIFGIVLGILFPIILLVNAFVLQPYILQQTLVLGSIWDVKSCIIGKILDEMMDSVLMKEELGKRLYLRLRANGQDIDELMDMLKEFDNNNDGSIDKDEMRSILDKFELHLSSFRFKALVSCLQRGTRKIHYADLYDMVKQHCGAIEEDGTNLSYDKPNNDIELAIGTAG